MTRLRFLLISLTFLLAGCEQRSHQVEHLVLISIDGLRSDYMDREGAAKHYPNLARFRLEGTYASRVQGVLPTMTFPSHTTLITGATPAQHGIFSNEIFDPDRVNHGGWNWYAEDIRSETLWQAAHRMGLTVGSVFWPVTVGAEIDYLIPAFWSTRSSLDSVRLLRSLSTPGLLGEIEEEFGPFQPGKQSDGESIRMGWQVFQRHRPALMLIKLSGLDGIQHRVGPGSPEAAQALRIVDEGIGFLMDRLDATGLNSKTLVAVVSDHGSTSIRWFFKPEVWFRSQGWTIYEGDKVQSWTASPLIQGGLCAVVLKDPDDQATLAEIQRVFSGVSRESEAIGRIYDKEAIERMGGFPEASLLIECAPGYMMETGHEGEPIVPASDKGAHGYTPDFQDQDGIFMILGPGMPAGKNLGRVRMLDIGPTLAEFLGMELRDAVGESLQSRFQ